MYRFPPYQPPFGIPVYWRNDISGRLPSVVQAFYMERVGQGPPLKLGQIELLVAYLAYFIHTPCWSDCETGLLEELRSEVKDLKTTNEIMMWISKSMEIALDPL